MYKLIQGLFSTLYDCSLTVNTQIHRKGRLQNAIYQVKQLKHFSHELALFIVILGS